MRPISSCQLQNGVTETENPSLVRQFVELPLNLIRVGENEILPPTPEIVCGWGWRKGGDGWGRRWRGKRCVKNWTERNGTEKTRSDRAGFNDSDPIGNDESLISFE
ncbi:hypothetical protein AVEN_117963-1 [Araneus ventricosus]|uniref:Uncharacterized protein n=1 Tax=Araneus ventricosus TaxID=182803 RepID=A0A4Y2H4M7_ARAVE|nr:hypothetical protein AVEN_117963-1 [Araneus ventricosus]